jgi:hypothetical protein
MDSSLNNLNWSKRLDDVIRILLFILIFWLPYSPAVIEICVVLGVFLWIIKRTGWIFLNRSASVGNSKMQGLRFYKPFSSPLNRPIGVFLITCLISVVMSRYFWISFEAFFTKTLEWFLIYFLILETFRKKRHVQSFLWIFIVTSLAVSFDGLYQYYFTHKDIFLGRFVGADGRATASFKAPTGFGAYLIVAIPVILSMIFLKYQKIWARMIISATYLILCWVLVLTFSRGPWAGLLGGFGFMLFLFFNLRYSMKNILWILGCVIIFFLLLSWGSFYPQPGGDTKGDIKSIEDHAILREERHDSADAVFSGKTDEVNNANPERSLAKSDDNLGATGLTSGLYKDELSNIFWNRSATWVWRLGVWEDSLKMVRERPIAGHGLNTYMRLFQDYRRKTSTGAIFSPTYAHNCYLQLMVETGWLGLLAFLWIIMKIFQSVIVSIKKKIIQDPDLQFLSIGLVSGIFAFFVHSFVDTNFYSLQLSSYLWVMTGVLMSIQRMEMKMVSIK